MQYCHLLHIENKNSELETYSALSRHEDELSYLSRRMKLQGAGNRDWWDLFYTQTKKEYLQSLDDQTPDPKILEQLPDETKYFNNYDELLTPLNGILFFLTDPETIDEEMDGETPDEESLFHPDNLTELLKELESIRDKVKEAKAANSGFILEMVVDY
jgi:hypothetical protein